MKKFLSEFYYFLIYFFQIFQDHFYSHFFWDFLKNYKFKNFQLSKCLANLYNMSQILGIECRDGLDECERSGCSMVFLLFRQHRKQQISEDKRVVGIRFVLGDGKDLGTVGIVGGSVFRARGDSGPQTRHVPQDQKRPKE